MKSRPKPRFERVHRIKQRGLVLFVALVALVALSLAAVALIRSVDTSTLIAGNLAFKQAATSSGDAGIEAAVTWMAGAETAAEAARAGTSLNVLNDVTHPFNNTGGQGAILNNGYYSDANPTKSLTDSSGTGFKWDNTDSVLVGTDSSGNTIRYIIQRMCRTPNQRLNTANCLFSGAPPDNGQRNTKLTSDQCDPNVSLGCPKPGQAPMNRITARTTGPRNTISYVQALAY